MPAETPELSVIAGTRPPPPQPQTCVATQVRRCEKLWSGRTKVSSRADPKLYTASGTAVVHQPPVQEGRLPLLTAPTPRSLSAAQTARHRPDSHLGQSYSSKDADTSCAGCPGG